MNKTEEKRGVEMSCQYLWLHDGFYCMSESKCLRPTKEVLESSCMGGGHSDCVFYKAYTDKVEVFSYGI
jgi:hypothetical protein